MNLQIIYSIGYNEGYHEKGTNRAASKPHERTKLYRLHGKNQANNV
jgi:hypothetical protein